MSKAQSFDRAAGILMAVSSLPSPYGIGTFGRAAYEFVDFVSECHHRYWQVLPLGPTTYGDSPYQSYSAFAGNPYYIDLDMLIEEGLLYKDEVDCIQWDGHPEYVDYERMYNYRSGVLKKAYERFKTEHIKKDEVVTAYRKFKEDNSYWLLDYCLFMALKVHYNHASWTDWDDDIKFRTAKGLETYKNMLSDDVEYYMFIQYKFDEQWQKLKLYAAGKNVQIIGDMPIYMGYDSADVWANTKDFLLDENLTPLKVAGVPPDAFSELGQKWGNPLYNWESIEEAGFVWWKKRMEHMAKLYDVIRIDHFIGLVKYYTIPYECPDAREGSYEEGPGQKLLDVINEAVGDKRIIAEDLGVALPEVDKLLKDNNYPSMKVMEFAFGGDRNNPHLPYNYNNNCVVYGGTHDNETLFGYFTEHSDWELGYAYDYLDTRDKNRMVDVVFRQAYGSVARLVVFATQDILKLGNYARMNTPSTFGNNWKWRMLPHALNQKHINDMRYLASVFGRE